MIKQNIHFLLSLLVLLGVSLSTMSQEKSIDWFDGIIPQGDHSQLWGNDKVLFDCIEEWKDDEGVVRKIKGLGADENAARTKAQFCTKCRLEFADIIKDVKAGEWYKFTKEYVSSTLKAAQRLWDAAIKVYFKDSLVVVGEKAAGDGQRGMVPITAKMPFGPWVLWTTPEWNEISRKWSREERKKRLNQRQSPFNPNPNNNPNGGRGSILRNSTQHRRNANYNIAPPSSISTNTNNQQV